MSFFRITSRVLNKAAVTVSKPNPQPLPTQNSVAESPLLFPLVQRIPNFSVTAEPVPPANAWFRNMPQPPKTYRLSNFRSVRKILTPLVKGKSA